ncbi:uncharacterized protein LTR77_009565 [Saxophila tyrrhenica]|uniref:DNA replication factor Cdt1 C-terminal domain-containing protein n=1 Tax=Saxophila tyrrhenica TaxID=1690608 RepID=A0AAV9NXZ9_9PEZI|nr:hypothetical protein LTR77_009565 [Saxophila tyrrhenica]
MAAQRKRKHVAEEQPPNHQHGIKAFGTIGKAHDANDVQKKRKTAHVPDDKKAILQQEAKLPKNKRKRALDQDEDDSAAGSAFTVQPIDSKQSSLPTASTPRNKRFKNVQPPSSKETPSKSTADLFRNMKLEKPSAPIPFALNAGQLAYGTPPKTPEPNMDDSSQLPPELMDLVSLHSAFLSALSMYYAHNGTSSPAEVKALLPNITKHWKKRAVSMDDLRTLLAVEQQVEPEFLLKDFGRAGIRLVKSAPRGRAIKRSASYIDEVDTNARFENALQDRWSSWLAGAPKESCRASTFLDQLPLAEVEKAASVEKAAPMFARGQQRLADLKASQAPTTSDTSSTTSVSTEQKSTAAVQNRGTSLLDRILAKQALTSTLPAGPTRDQLERKAALQRIEDVARVLELLAAGRPRCSFSMQGLSQQVRQSLRNPISKEEIERCFDLMATEITPGFVGLVKNGAVTGVVITKSGKVGSEELRQRVKNACEAMPSRV